MKKWLRRRIFKRLLKVENLNISRTERKIKRTAYWMTIATLSWGIPFTTDFTEHWVFENPSSVVSESVSPENPADILAVGTDTGDDGVQSGDESEGKVEALIAEAFPEDIKTAIAIAKSESGLRNVKGDIPIEFVKDGKVMGHSCGVFQIRVLPGRPDCETLMDPVENVKYARKIYDRVGWTAWSNFKNGAYKKFL